MKPVLELKNITKKYGSATVLSNVSLSLKPGEIRGLIGENGAGKSTLMKILFGMPVIHETGGYKGEFSFEGQPALWSNPQAALKAGVGMVHQEFMLIPSFGVAENIRLNCEPTKPFFIPRWKDSSLALLDRDTMRRRAQEALAQLGMSIDVDVPVSKLPVAHWQFIELARELDRSRVKVLVLDEPTAVLAETEADELLQVMKRLAQDKNIAFLFISHRLAEIQKVCDSLTILRDGQCVGNYQRGELDVAQMASLMVGRDVHLDIPKLPLVSREGYEPDADPVLTIRHASVDYPGENLRDFSLTLYPGEILGLGGMAGQGKLALANGLAGLAPMKGEVFLNGKPYNLNNPKAALQSGVVFLSEDRKQVGLILEESIAHNIVLTSLCLYPDFLFQGVGRYLGLIDFEAVEQHALLMKKKLDIRCNSVVQPVGQLSGGNQQKVCMARAMTLRPRLLLVSEPTRGVDIGAKRTILEEIVRLAESGVTIIVTSSELVELKAVSDRIAIVTEGRISAVLDPSDSDAAFGLAMQGGFNHEGLDKTA
jgi:simple sugar transport system ATP-binding protein